jgi:uncharacterized protein YecE (DUF72 family)
MWAHAAWPGRHLPAGVRRDRYLASYATWCTAVEGNTTFYAVPAPAVVAGWAAQAPAGFRLLCKLPRTITHDRRLRDAGAELGAFCDVLAPLGDRARTLSVQLPASFGPGDLDALARFLRTWPAAHRAAVEVRHPEFFERPAVAAALERVLRGAGAEWVTFDTSAFFAASPGSDAEREAWAAKPRLPRRVVALGDEPVLRYLGRDDPAETEAGWQHWLPVVAGWLREGRSPVVFVHTPDNVDAPVLARRFHDAVRVLVPGLTPLPEPDVATPTTLF